MLWILLLLMILIIFILLPNSFALANVILFNFVSFYLGDFIQHMNGDRVSYLCLVMLVICGCISLEYCRFYSFKNQDMPPLFSMMVCFICVMGVLVLSNSLILTLMFWEYLGLISYFLILFYSNLPSMRASFITLFISRLGDVAIFLIFAICCVYGVYAARESYYWVLLISLVVFSKSAIFPFISWLLEAMMAPTPVSALVHSSTLVAAGVWFYLRYSHYFVQYSGLYSLLALFTIFITGVAGLFFKDIKKLLALSTCNNVCWCIVFLSMSEPRLALIQLVIHGVSKCVFFIIVGDGISASGGAQHHSGFHLSRVAGFWMSCGFMVLVASLSGFPFLGIFIIKHAVFVSHSIFFENVVHWIFLWASYTLTYCYCTRLFFLLCGRSVSRNCGYHSTFLLCSMCGLVYSLQSAGCLALSCSVEEDCCSNGALSFFFSFFLLIGCLSGVLFYLSEDMPLLGRWSSVLWGSDCIVSFFYSCYLSVSRCCYLVSYRWEQSILRSAYGGSLRLCGYNNSLLSLNFMFLGILFLFLCGFTVF